MHRLLHQSVSSFHYTIRFLLRYCLPRVLRYALYRRLLHIEYELPEGMTIKIVQSGDELEQALNLLYNVYVRAGYMKPHPSRLRVTKYHALPNTITLVASDKGKIIGTLTIIPDSTFGIPSDHLEGVRHSSIPRSENLAEISSLALDPRYRKMHGHILFHLFKYMIQYLTHHTHVSTLIICIKPQQVELYASLFALKVLSRRAVEYSFVNGARGVIMSGNLKEVYLEGYAHYRGAQRERNFFQFMYEEKTASYVFPEHRYYETISPFLTPHQLETFFAEKTKVFQELSEEERIKLWNLYPFASYRRVLPRPQSEVDGRKQTRVSVKMQAVFYYGKNEFAVVEVLDISEHGLRFQSQLALLPGTVLTLVCSVAPFVVSKIKGKIVWKSPSNIYGYHILKADAEWRELAVYINDKMHGHTAASLSNEHERHTQKLRKAG